MQNLLSFLSVTLRFFVRNYFKLPPFLRRPFNVRQNSTNVKVAS